MNLSYTLQFLRDLSANNTRVWFNEHRDEYEKAHAEFELFLTRVIALLAQFDPTVRHIQAKDCTYRIYRDTRFSPDKTPYKNHMGGFINAKGKKSPHCGYYIHLQPDNCHIGGGNICFPPKILQAIRQSIYHNVDEYIDIVEDPAFKQYFPTAGENFLKTTPKGFPKDFPHIRYLQCKDYACSHHVADAFFTQSLEAEGGVAISNIFTQLKRFLDFLNHTIDDFE